jgi:hypothetical protein
MKDSRANCRFWRRTECTKDEGMKQHDDTSRCRFLIGID